MESIWWKFNAHRFFKINFLTRSIYVWKAFYFVVNLKCPKLNRPRLTVLILFWFFNFSDIHTSFVFFKNRLFLSLNIFGRTIQKVKTCNTERYRKYCFCAERSERSERYRKYCFCAVFFRLISEAFLNYWWLTHTSNKKLWRISRNDKIIHGMLNFDTKYFF